MEPAEALRRIAYLLERGRAETYKVRAFRKAADAVDQTPPDRLTELAESGRLTSIEGLGKSTAEVVAQALEGETPDYLKNLEGEQNPQADEAATALRQALRGDCHSHSNWSDGGSPIDEMAAAAKDLGHEYWALTDHSPRLTVAHGLNRERLLQQLDVLEELNETMAPFRILTGIEVDILEDGSLDQDEDLLERLDVVVASVHSKLRMPEPEMTTRMLKAIESPHTDILGHCTGRLLVGRGRPQSTFDADRIFAACAATSTAVEINSRPERLDPPLDLLATALDAGCLFSISTDAHAPGQLEWQENGCRQAVEAGVPVARVVNARSVDVLLAWTASHTA